MIAWLIDSSLDTRCTRPLTRLSKKSKSSLSADGSGQVAGRELEQITKYYVSLGIPEMRPVSDFLLPDGDDAIPQKDCRHCSCVDGDKVQTHDWAMLHAKVFAEKGLLWPASPASLTQVCGDVRHLLTHCEAEVLYLILMTVPAADLEQVLDLSQNLIRVGTPIGHCACLTPDGLFWLRNRGRLLCNEEMLRIPGLWLTLEAKARYHDATGKPMSDTILRDLGVNVFNAGSLEQQQS